MLATVCCWLFCWYSSGFSKKKEKGNQAPHRSHLKFFGGCNSLGLSAAQNEFPPTSLHMTIIAHRVCCLNTQKGSHFDAHKDLHFQVWPLPSQYISGCCSCDLSWGLYKCISDQDIVKRTLKAACSVSGIGAASQEEQDNHLPEYSQCPTAHLFLIKPTKARRFLFCLRWQIRLHRHPWGWEYGQV